MANIDQIIIKPLLTEKTSVATEGNNSYGFEVDLKSNKNQIKGAIERLFDVKVLSVNTNITPGKLKRFGRHIKKSGKVKKAYVQIAEGQKIEFFKDI
jgi:large subunit ribosomal protein L23